MEAKDMQTEWRLDEIRNLIHQHAKAKSERVQLEHFRKVKKALLMKQAEQDGYHAVGAQEREAYAHSEYSKLVDALAIATGQETETWWMLRMEEWKFESWRTRMASERVERVRYGAG